MAFIDLIIVLIIAGFVFFGFFFGFVHSLGNLLGAIIGVFLASSLTGNIASFFGADESGGTKVIIFIITFFLISRIVGIIFWVIEKMGGMASFIPFAKTVNRLLGAVFGLIEGVIVIAVILFIALQYLDEGSLLTILESSSIAGILFALIAAIQVIFPQSLSL